MVRYILPALMVVAAWCCVLWLDAPLWMGFAVTGAALAVLATVLILRFVRARRASREIERALRAQAEAQSKTARPDKQAEIAELRRQFDDAVSALKRSRLGAKGASTALYSLPWYVILGPSGAGKSTALRNSGLKFPFLSPNGDVSVQGVGGTRNCEWWMTSDAIILDTAGRYATEEADHEEWMGFLDLLTRYRRRRPINGVLAATSLADLLHAHPSEIESLAADIRARADELQGRLGVVLPVYVLLTKADLLPGFVEMFGDLDEEERAQICGFTLQVKQQYDLESQVLTYFDELTARLEKRALRRFADERSEQARQRIHMLAQHLAAARDNLGRFVRELMRDSMYHEAPILRGVYLSSGAQQGRPVDGIMASIAEAFGLKPSTPGAPAIESTGYFLRDLFHKVVFADHALPRPNRKRTLARRRFGRIVGGITLAAASAMIVFPLASFRRNRELLTDAGVALSYVEQHAKEDTIEAIPVRRLEPLRSMVAKLAAHEDEGTPWRLKMGMYQGSSVYPRLRDVYAQTVRRELVVPTVEQESSALWQLVSEHHRHEAELEDYESAFDGLRMLLLLSQPAQAGEPGLDPRQRQWLAKALAVRWEEPLRTSGEPASSSAIEAVAATYVDLVAREPGLAFERDEAIVARTRVILRRTDRSRAIANRLVASVEGRPLRLSDLTHSDALLNDGRIIHPAFTRSGYFDEIKPRLEGDLDELLGEQWVLGFSPDDQHRRQQLDRSKIETEYFRWYIEQWSRFLETIYIRNGRDLKDSKRLLDELARHESPYQRLFAAVRHHTELVDLYASPKPGDDSTKVDQTAERVAGVLGSRGGAQASKALGAGKLGLGGAVSQAAAQHARMQMRKRVHELRANPEDAKGLDARDVTVVFSGLIEFSASASSELESPEAAAVSDSALGRYLVQLRTLRDALRSSIASSAKDDKRAAAEELLETRAALDRLLASDDAYASWDPTLRNWLEQPIAEAERALEADYGDDVLRRWCNEVVNPFERKFADRYPFDATGRDLHLRDFADYYADSGVLWSHYDKELSADILRTGDTFELSEAAGSLHYTRDVLRFLEASHALTQAVMAGDPKPNIEFDVLIRGTPQADRIQLTVDGKTIEYRNGPETQTQMSWPGEGRPGARLAVQGAAGSTAMTREGPWGLFRLLEAGTVAPTDGSDFLVQWDFRDEGLGIVEIQISPKREDNPFFGLSGHEFLGPFRDRRLEAPRALSGRGKSCPPATPRRKRR